MALRQAQRTGTSLVFENGDSITFDATVNELPVRDSRPAQHPIEDKSKVTDHKQALAVVLSITAWFTDSPVFPAETEPASARAERLYRQVLAAFEDSKILTHISYQEIIPSLMIQRVDSPRNTGTGNSYQVNIAFIQATFVHAEEASIPARLLRPRVKKRATDPADTGKQPGEEGSEEKGSVAHQAYKKLVGNKTIKPLSALRI